MNMKRILMIACLLTPIACSGEQPPVAAQPAAQSASQPSAQPAAGTGAEASSNTTVKAGVAGVSAEAGVSADLKAGTYRELKDAQPTEDANRIEVVEVFLYSCPHCYEFDPQVNAWRKTLPDDVLFRHMPATFGPNGEILAKAYYTAKALNVLDTMHAEMFDAIHKRGMQLDSPAKIKALFTAKGVDGKDFDDYFNSFEVDSKFRLASRMQINYGITAVPAMVVNGKYRTSARLAGGTNEDALRVVNQLIDKERSSD